MPPALQVWAPLARYRHQTPLPGDGVVLVAEHLCMTLRGARAEGSTTVTSALHGVLLDDHAGARGVLRAVRDHRRDRAARKAGR